MNYQLSNWIHLFNSDIFATNIGFTCIYTKMISGIPCNSMNKISLYIIYRFMSVGHERFPSLQIGGTDCRDVIVEKPCTVGAQPTGKCTKYNVMIAVGIPLPSDLIVICHFMDWRYKPPGHKKWRYKSIHAFKLAYCSSHVCLMWARLCLHLFTFVTSSHVHGKVPYEEGRVDLKLVTSINNGIILLQMRCILEAATRAGWRGKPWPLAPNHDQFLHETLMKIPDLH